ncbi:MAG: hypothetical protein E3J72_21965 [Planctomycetota bacterium]|nr:MAG: hypothetical protein E3J72_21965 [Planctomycetota bacterium]
MQSVSLSRSHVVVACVFIFSVLGPSCSIKGFKDKPYLTPRVIVTTPAGVQQEDITLTYRLIEVDGTGSDISLEFSTDGGQTWSPGTAKGGDGTMGIAGGPYPGFAHTIMWDSFADGISGVQTARVKIIAVKTIGIEGTPGTTDDFQIQNPDFPVISWIAKPEGTVRQVPLTFTWQLDTPSIPIANYYYGPDEDPPTSTTTNTSVTIPAPSLGMHTFRVYASSTAGLNSAVLAATFTCDNAAANVPPTVVITSGPSGTINQNSTFFEWQGNDVDGSITSYEYDFDCGGWIDVGLDTSRSFMDLSNGSHSFSVRARDNDGAYSVPDTRIFLVELSGPGGLPFELVQISHLPMPGDVYGLDVGGNYAYISDHDTGLHVVDVSDKTNPQILSTCPSAEYPWDVRVIGDYAFQAAGRIFEVIDVSNPDCASLVTSLDITGICIFVFGNYAYLGNGSGFSIVNISNPLNPNNECTVTTPRGATSIYVIEPYAYVAFSVGEVEIYNITNKQNPVVDNAGIGDSARALICKDNYIFLGDSDDPSLRVYDITVPLAPQFVSSTDDTGLVSRFFISGDYLFNTAGGAGARMLDISDPANPTLVGTSSHPGQSAGLHVDWPYIYTVGVWRGLTILEIK